MTTYTEDVLLEAPIATAFDCVDRQELILRWMVGLERLEYLNAGKVDMDKPVGLKFIQHVREGKRVNAYEGVVILHEKPTRLGVRLSHRMFTMDISYHFRKVAEGRTSLLYQVGITYSNWFARLMGSLFRGMTLKIIQRHMAELQKVAKEVAGKK